MVVGKDPSSAQKTDFWPHPAIDTVLLEIKPREEPLLGTAQRTAYERFVTRLFENSQYLSTITKYGSLPASRHTAAQAGEDF
jgi:16S rRNA A1518/A1519 N6-dimethyltransferase RsmA/KsgA/DIM1 with predicted DNA glycosylase/AP lyase activity